MPQAAHLLTSAGSIVVGAAACARVKVWHCACLLAPAVAGRRGRVLVVDDEPSLCAIIAEALVAEGYHVRTAKDGAEALELLRREPAEAIVTDLMMPTLDGWRLIEACRAASGDAVGVVTVSALVDDDAVERLQKLGVRHCLAKPFEIQELLRCVSEVVRP